MNMPIIETFFTIVIVVGAAVFSVMAAMCWLRERYLVAARKTRPRSRKAVVKAAVASMMTAGAIWYGGSKGIRESGGMDGQQPPVAVAYEDTLLPLRSGDEPHFATIMPTNDCMLLKIALPSGGVADNLLDLFSTTNLLTSWSLLGEISVSVSTVTAEVLVASSDFPDAPSVMPVSAFFASGTHVDSDGDGIFDSRERFLHGTNPSHWDTDGDGLSDGDEITSGIDPLSRDTDGDGYPDDEEIAFSTNPLVANTGAATTIRYVYDDDDRLTATYVGADGGASLTGWTSTGDPATASERAAHD